MIERGYGKIINMSSTLVGCDRGWEERLLFREGSDFATDRSAVD